MSSELVYEPIINDADTIFTSTSASSKGSKRSRSSRGDPLQLRRGSEASSCSSAMGTSTASLLPGQPLIDEGKVGDLRIKSSSTLNNSETAHLKIQGSVVSRKLIEAVRYTPVMADDKDHLNITQNMDQETSAITSALSDMSGRTPDSGDSRTNLITNRRPSSAEKIATIESIEGSKSPLNSPLLDQEIQNTIQLVIVETTTIQLDHENHSVSNTPSADSAEAVAVDIPTKSTDTKQSPLAQSEIHSKDVMLGSVEDATLLNSTPSETGSIENITLSRSPSVELTELSIIEDETDSIFSLQSNDLHSFHSPIDVNNYRLLHNRRHSPPNHSGCISILLYTLCALLVFPLLLTLLPVMLLVKLVAFLICCVPCKRGRSRMGTSQQSSPLYFKTKGIGGYYTTAIILKERISSDFFADYVVTKLYSAFSDNDLEQKTIVLKLASVLKKQCCFSWWVRSHNLNLDDHVHIINRRFITSNDLTNFLGELSAKESKREMWSIYFIPFYKNIHSVIVLQTHHSLASGTTLKNTLINLFTSQHQTMSSRLSSTKEESQIQQPSMGTILLKAPAKVTKILLKPPPVSTLFRRLTGKKRFAFSGPMSLKDLYTTANTFQCSLEAILLTCLAKSFGKIFNSNLNFAIPVSIGSQTSAYFVSLSSSQHNSTEKVIAKIERQLQANYQDAYIHNVASKFASFAVSDYTANSFASLVAKQASGIFTLIKCPLQPLQPLYLDDDSILSVLSWPPLFNRFNMAVCVVCYSKTFRICIVTDRAVADWPGLLLETYIADYFNVCCCK